MNRTLVLIRLLMVCISLLVSTAPVLVVPWTLVNLRVG